MRSFHTFNRFRRDNSLDVGSLHTIQDEEAFNGIKLTECLGCSLPLFPGMVVVSADKFSNVISTCQRYLSTNESGHSSSESEGPKKSYFHPKCFVCSACGELLVDLIYCVGRRPAKRRIQRTIKSRPVSTSSDKDKDVPPDIIIEEVEDQVIEEEIQLIETPREEDFHLFCPRHFAETRIPRCPTCDQVSDIFLSSIEKDFATLPFCLPTCL